MFLPFANKRDINKNKIKNKKKIKNKIYKYIARIILIRM